MSVEVNVLGTEEGTVVGGSASLKRDVGKSFIAGYHVGHALGSLGYGFIEEIKAVGIAGGKGRGNTNGGLVDVDIAEVGIARRECADVGGLPVAVEMQAMCCCQGCGGILPCDFTRAKGLVSFTVKGVRPAQELGCYGYGKPERVTVIRVSYDIVGLELAGLRHIHDGGVGEVITIEHLEVEGLTLCSGNGQRTLEFVLGDASSDATQFVVLVIHRHLVVGELITVASPSGAGDVGHVVGKSGRELEILEIRRTVVQFVVLPIGIRLLVPRP